MRSFPLALFLLAFSGALGTVAAGGCGAGSSPGPGEATAARADSDASDSSTGGGSAEHSATGRRTRALAQRFIAQADSAFRVVEPLSANEKHRLRRYLQDEQLERARRLGLPTPVRDRRSAADLARPSDSSAVRLFTNEFYIVDPAMSYAVPLVIPSAAHLLGALGRRFQSALMERGLPPYRFVLTNILRTGQDQAALRGTNINAAQGTSTHEYGTTFDVFYEWFHYAATNDPLARGALPPAPDSTRAARLDEKLLRRLLYAAYRRDGKEHARQIKAVLGRTILEMQQEGLLMAIYERQESVFHLTVAHRVEAPAGDFPTASSTPGAARADSTASPPS